MCGFVGYYGTGDYNREKVLDEMGELIVHRGPDSKGSYVDDKAALGFRRLSIIDLEGGTQPIHSADGKHLIIFNGEVYNYKEIRKELTEKHGAVFQTNSDTEAILQAYKVYGEKTASMLRGMFSFVIYDKEKQTMYGARDYFGIKPFYYTNMNDTFIFGSEIKSFLAHPSFQKEVNKDALKLYLIFQYTPTKETMFKDVYKLEPGTYFTYDGKEFKETRYFDFKYQVKKRGFDEVVKEIGKTVQESVDYHQISDVEVGSFLSGGVDSSYIASSVKPMKTYSVGFKVEGFDETVYSQELCKILNMKNAKKEITPDEFFDILPRVQYQSDEPHANLSAVPLYFLSQLAAKDVKVVLSGEGADEMFGGYDSYIDSGVEGAYRKLPLALRRKLGKWASKKKYFKGRELMMRNTKTLEDSYVGQSYIMDNHEADAILSKEYQSKVRYQDVTKPYFDQVKDLDDLHKKMFLDMNVWLPHDILLKADKMTMAHSIELRVPYLDRKVWNLARTLESKQCVDGKNTKIAFRTAALAKIPMEWAKRKKLGFMVPVRVWMRKEKYYNQIKTVFEKDFVSEFFKKDILLKWLEDHKNKKGNYQRKIYTVYSFLLWYEQYFVLR
ncbi:asparagine synthase (glutamine-hydrolyzing) [Aequitasia blattaphilus]|uniref:asparagine synthase (glutamine-hydrolyzing) n=1 Tax=Aequitasia blattaphilus TaxID=2949332 RepID=A0ABT1EBF0_9FIRM|nr:asparagine synthase (glutamine-hydrolyzing) [Aequitasia blattaphilus]MCP1103163.1 asparagine synthase (glutamine-hydrolyzing) [Aequitasia blattaphilus]MCR8615803.1 asparagine synthase (glutamine-hydrolyzing) [Aequitasia blattaphilus]